MTHTQDLNDRAAVGWCTMALLPLFFGAPVTMLTWPIGHGFSQPILHPLVLSLGCCFFLLLAGLMFSQAVRRSPGESGLAWLALPLAALSFLGAVLWLPYLVLYTL